MTEPAAPAVAPVGHQIGVVPVSSPVAAPIFPEFSTIVPPDYKDKDYLKDVKDVPSLFKKLDNAVTTIGKRPAGIPQENADPKDWIEFNKAWGVPEKPEDYKLSDPPEGFQKNDNFQKGVKALFHKAGVSARQAGVIEKEWNALLSGLMKENGVVAEKQDADFKKLASEVFGERVEDALSGAKALIAKYAPAQVKTEIEKLSNENLIVMAGVLDAIRKEYISEDQLPVGGKSAGALTAEEKRAKGRELMANPAYSDAFHPDHAKIVAEVKKLYGTE